MKPIVINVDDDKEHRDTVQEVLDRDYDVRSFDRPEAALSAIRPLKEAIEEGLLKVIVVTDQHMPGMTGPEFLAQLQREGIDVPVIIVIATAEENVRNELQAHGVVIDKFIPKPVNMAGLQYIVGDALRHHHDRNSPKLSFTDRLGNIDPDICRGG
ncbi:MAG: response regulator [Pseudomonadota bacterium]|nr:response regulator [Pseudomonadota bacterium]